MKAKGGDVTAYINQFFTVRQPHNSAGAAMSKHVFIGNTRILSQVEHGANAFNNTTSGLGGSGTTSGSTSGSGGTTTGFVTVTTSGTVYQGASQSSPSEGTANVGDILELMPTGNSNVHNGTMVKVMFQGLIGFIPSSDVSSGGTGGGPGGGKGGNKGGGGSTGGTSTSVLPQVQDDHFVFYYHTDHLGSTGQVTDREGKLSENVQYFPFGETWIEQKRGMSPFPDYLFSGQTLDTETGLYYFGARYYDSRTSVWQSPDPLYPAYLDGSPHGGFLKSYHLALYSYVGQNPIVFVDPNGATDFYTGKGKLLERDNDGSDDVYMLLPFSLENPTEPRFEKMPVTTEQLITSSSAVYGETGSNRLSEMKAIAHVMNNRVKPRKGESRGAALERSAQHGFNGLHNESAKQYRDKDSVFNSKQGQKVRAAIFDVLLNGKDPTGGATRFEGVEYFGPLRDQSSAITDWVLGGEVYDPNRIGNTIFFHEVGKGETFLSGKYELIDIGKILQQGEGPRKPDD